MRRRSKRRGYCPNCLYIGDPKLCGCQWIVQQVAEGNGNDPKTIESAKAILKLREEQ